MKPYYQDDAVTIYVGDALETLRRLPAASVQTCATSPPYWGLRDYGEDGQMGLESTPEEYVAGMVEVFREVRRVLKNDGTLWLNLGDSYANAAAGGDMRMSEKTTIGRTHNGTGEPHYGGSRTMSRTPKSVPAGLKPKDLVGIPWRVAFALQADGWWLRSDIIWAKPNPMPESVTDRPTKSHEYVFLLSKSERYYYDHEAVAEPLATDPSENYPARARITGRGTQGSADARGNDRDKSGGFPPREKKRNARSGGEGTVEPWTENEAGTRNRRSVWTITTKPYAAAHFATFPPELPEVCIKAGSMPGDTVLDPFAGAGTTLYVAKELQRKAIGIELNPKYARLAADRCVQHVLPLEAS